METTHPFEKSYEHNGLRVIECQKCDFRHLLPIPAPEELEKTYCQRFAGDIRKGFRDRKKKDNEYSELLSGRRFKTWSELLPGQKIHRLLDIGCGMGDMLYYFQKKGWDTYGIEPSLHFAKDLESKGIPYIAKMAEQLKPGDFRTLGRFDVINLSMVLEHVGDPIGLMQVVMDNLLSDNGILTLESPNDFNPLQIASQQACDLEPWGITPIHVNYFDFESLERLILKFGLTPVLRETQFPIELFLLFGEVYVGDEKLGKEIHLKRVAFEKNMVKYAKEDVLNQLYRALANHGIGRQAIVHARRA